jgi:hypothetical protein
VVVVVPSSPDAAYGRRGRCHKIVLRHNVTSGHWVLIIDGRFEACGYEPIITRKFSITFKLSHNNCYIDVTMAMPSFHYQHEFYVDQIQQRSFHQLAQSPFTETIPLQISIPTYILQSVTGTGEVSGSGTAGTAIAEKKDVAYFQIQVKTGYQEMLTVYHRYSEFDLLDKCLKSQMDGHLRSSLPNLPGKVFNPFVNQLSEEFLELRKGALERYLITLLGNSKVLLPFLLPLPAFFIPSPTPSFCRLSTIQTSSVFLELIQ